MSAHLSFTVVRDCYPGGGIEEMATFDRGNAHIYYEDTGEGEPIVTIHGLTENTTYWSLTGVTEALAKSYRVISMDMRGHGRSRVDGEPYGYDVETIASDIGALADLLSIDRFHLLAHATGGMAAIRFAMSHSDRLISLLLTNTGPATAPLPAGVTPEMVTPELIEAIIVDIEGIFKGKSWDEIIAGFRENPLSFMAFFGHLDDTPDPEKTWARLDEMLRLGDPDTLAQFARSYFDDPNLYEEKLRGIKCPTLVLTADHDDMFRETCEVVAREIPDNRHVVMPGIGHMTAMEAPEQTIDELKRFLQSVAATGKASG
jgi:pimeloyl-ACP methyl ester carboxylesterase